MEQEIATLIKQQPLDGRTPVKGVDYFDGKDGKDGTDGADGKDSVSTHVIEQQTVIKEIPINGKDGVDGRTPELSCNERENRWEIRYFGDTRWKLLNGKIIKCTTEMVLQ